MSKPLNIPDLHQTRCF